MLSQKQCIDFYGEKLKVGDEVVPMLEEAVIISIGGIISKIEYSERYNNYYITITDKEGNVLLDGVDARCYTTQARYNERENQKYVYSLIFYSDKLYPIATLPLTNRIDENYEIPENTCLVLLVAQYLTEKGKGYSSYSTKTIYNYFLEGDIKLCCDKKNADYNYDFYYVVNNNGNWYPIYGSYKNAQSEEELKECVKTIIEYFKYSDLSHVNNDVVYDGNKKVKEFEKKLAYKLKY